MWVMTIHFGTERSLIMHEALMQRIAALNCWTSEITCEPLTGGITNLSFIVTSEQGRFVARVCEERRYLGIDRTNEWLCQVAAHKAGVSGEVLFFDDGILVTPFIVGKTLSDVDVTQVDVLIRTAQTMRQLHASLDHIEGELLYFCPFQTIRTYAATAKGLGAFLPVGVTRFMALLPSLRGEISPFTPTLCHNDLLPANILDDGTRLWFVDWEYAGMGNPLFDLANLTANRGLSPELENVLIHAYFGAANERAFAEVQVLKTVSLLREALWGVIQGIKSTIEFDYEGYTTEQLMAFEQSLETLPMFKA
jgi:thiamine kinase-like enzyme